MTATLITGRASTLYEADWRTHSIYRFTPDGTRSLFVSGLSSPEGLAFDAAGNLYVGNAGASQILKITPDGTQSVFGGFLLNPFGLAFNQAGDLFASSDNGHIYKIAPDGSMTTFASGFNQPFGIAFDSRGNLFVADAGHYQIVKITPGGQQSVFASGIYNNPRGLAINSADELFMSNYGGIIKYQSDGTSSVFSSSVAVGIGMAFDSSGDLFVADFGDDKIFKFKPDGTMTIFSSQVSGPFGLVFEAVPEPSILGLAAILGLFWFKSAKQRVV